MKTDSISIKIGGVAIWLTVLALLALTAFYPIYSWIPQLTNGVFVLYSVLTFLLAIVFVACAVLINFFGTEDIWKSYKKDENLPDLDARLRKEFKKTTGLIGKTRFIFWLVLTTGLAFCADFIVSGIIYFISVLMIRASVVSFSKARIKTLDKREAERLNVFRPRNSSGQ